MIRIIFDLPGDQQREQKRMLPAVPRIGDHIGWNTAPDGYREEHTVTSVCWELGQGEPYVLVTLDDRVIDGKSVNSYGSLGAQA